jgi:hypothetical protein
LAWLSPANAALRFSSVLEFFRVAIRLSIVFVIKPRSGAHPVHAI